MATMDPEAMRAHAADAARLLKVLAGDKRLMLLCLLVEREHSVRELNARGAEPVGLVATPGRAARGDGLVSTRRGHRRSTTRSPPARRNRSSPPSTTSTAVPANDSASERMDSLRIDPSSTPAPVPGPTWSIAVATRW